jgi:hypothetical protein
MHTHAAMPTRVSLCPVPPHATRGSGTAPTPRPSRKDVVLQLIWFGAIYYCHVTPLPRDQKGPPLSAAQMASIMEARAAGLKQWGNNVSVAPSRCGPREGQLGGLAKLQRSAYAREHVCRHARA